MCQGDMSLYTYRWLPEQDEPAIVAGMQHMCVDFDRVMDWAADRSFSLNERLLKSPYQGEQLSFEQTRQMELTRA